MSETTECGAEINNLQRNTWHKYGRCCWKSFGWWSCRKLTKETKHAIIEIIHAFKRLWSFRFKPCLVFFWIHSKHQFKINFLKSSRTLITCKHTTDKIGTFWNWGTLSEQHLTTCRLMAVACMTSVQRTVLIWDQLTGDTLTQCSERFSYPLTRKPQTSTKYSIIGSLKGWLAQMVQADWLLVLNLD